MLDVHDEMLLLQGLSKKDPLQFQESFCKGFY